MRLKHRIGVTLFLLACVVCADAEHAAITIAHQGSENVWVSLKGDTANFLLASKDGGRTWKSISTVAGFHALYFLSPKIGWSLYLVQKDDNHCFVLSNTSDSGYSWHKSFSNCGGKGGYSIADVLFINQERGFLLSDDADDGLLLQTKDGGHSFRIVPELTGKGQLSSILWDGAQHLLVLGRDFIGVSDDQGRTWKRVEATEGVLLGRTQFFLTRGQLFPSGHGYLVDGNEIYESTDFGLHWLSTFVAEDVHFFSDISFADDENGCASGFSETNSIYCKINGHNWMRISGPPVEDDGSKILGTMKMTKHLLMTIDNDSQLYQSRDLGQTWTKAPLGTPAPLRRAPPDSRSKKR